MANLFVLGAIIGILLLVLQLILSISIEGIIESPVSFIGYYLALFSIAGWFYTQPIQEEYGIAGVILLTLLFIVLFLVPPISAGMFIRDEE